MIRRNPNATSALLQKVSSQLKGERIKKDEDEDDLNAYLKSLTQKTSQQRKSVNFEDVGEISISSEMDTSSSQMKKRSFVTSGNKFLKTKQTEDSPGAKFLKKPQTSSSSPVPTISSQGRPDTAKSQGQPSVIRFQGQGRPQSAGAQGVGRSSSASALNKAAALSNKFAQRSAEMRNVFTLETDTSESFSTPRPQTPLGRPKSADSDSFKLGKDGNKFLKKKPETRDTKPRSPTSRSPKSTSPVPKQRDDRQKFLKKKDKAEVIDPKTKTKASPYALKSSLKYSTDVVLSSGEESLAEFISGLDKKGKKGTKHSQSQIKEFSKGRSPSLSHHHQHHRSPSPDSKPPTARRTPPHSPSPTPRRSQSPAFKRRSPSPGYRRSRSRSSGDSDFGDSLQSEVIEEVRDEESISSEDAFRFNVMEIDSLEPVLISKPASPKEKRKSRDKTKKASYPFKKQEKKKKDSKRRKSDNGDFFSNMGIQSVDDLFGGVSGLEEKVEIASLASEPSEIKTQSESEEIHTEKPSVLGQKKSQGISFHSIIESEIKTQGSRSSSRKNSYSEDFEDSISERIGQASVRVSKMRTLSEIPTRYSGDETMADDYTEDFGSDTESIATVSKTSQTSEKTITDSYRSESYTETYTHGDRSPVTDSRPTGQKRMKSVEVQTREPGLHYAWDSRYSGYAVPGSGFVDPTPIATHVVSPDALEAMTAYSPSMLALQDLLKQQLQLTRDFLQTQQYLYKSLADNIDTSFKYTTLEETKHYIKKHRKKRLTFKEALKLVDRECG